MFPHDQRRCKTCKGLARPTPAGCIKTRVPPPFIVSGPPHSTKRNRAGRRLDGTLRVRSSESPSCRRGSVHDALTSRERGQEIERKKPLGRRRVGRDGCLPSRNRSTILTSKVVMSCPKIGLLALAFA